MIPLYGFLEGDTIGLLVLAEPGQRLADIAERLEQSASVRVRPGRRLWVRVHDQILDPQTTVAAAGLEALDRFDLVGAPGASGIEPAVGEGSG